MHKIVQLIFLVGLAAVSTGAVAQETTAAEADAATTEAEATDDLSLGEPVGPQIGDLYVRETLEDWAVRCVKAPEGEAEACTMYQLLQNDAGVAVAEANIFPLPAGGQAAAGANIVAPLETLLTEQLTIAIETRLPRRYPFAFCNRSGCVARLGFTEEEVGNLKATQVAQVSLVPAAAPTTLITLDMSLSGFTAAYNALAAAN